MEVQFRPSCDTVSRKQLGKKVGSLQISGFVLKKSTMLFQDSWSAKVLAVPTI